MLELDVDSSLRNLDFHIHPLTCLIHESIHYYLLFINVLKNGRCQTDDKLEIIA